VDAGEKAYLVLLPFQEIRVEFLNSVTGRPVLLEFRPLFRFQGFRAYTDPETEAYYTGGTYPWNQALAKERRRALLYCSELGLAVRVGGGGSGPRRGACASACSFPPSAAPGARPGG
jgi:hypothetical protein